MFLHPAFTYAVSMNMTFALAAIELGTKLAFGAWPQPQSAWPSSEMLANAQGVRLWPHKSGLTLILPLHDQHRDRNVSVSSDEREDR